MQILLLTTLNCNSVDNSLNAVAFNYANLKREFAMMFKFEPLISTGSINNINKHEKSKRK